MEFRVLGPLELRRGRAAGKQGALLGLLLLHPNRAVGAERLLDALWGGDRPRSAANLLQGYVSQLRKTLGPERIRTVAAGYLVSVTEDELDSLRFARLLDAAREASDPVRTSALLTEALELWRGELLEGLPLDLAAQPEAVRLDNLRREALELRLEVDLDLGRHAHAVAELEALVAREPLRERSRELLMLALYRAGRQADALAEYRRFRTVLAGEIGIEPGPELRRLEQAILRQDPALMPARRASAARLPAPPTPLLGRERELERALRLLRRGDVRLLTLTGTGGIGKTRLALELAGRLDGDLPGGAHVVPLASVADPRLVHATMAQTLGVPASALVRHLADRPPLLVLDNFEHLLPAAPALAELLAEAPGLKLLVTSTAVLRLYEEHELEVPPLALPEPGDDGDPGGVPSVALFVHRARAANNAFALDAESAPVVAEICRRVDGLPLAIELAAARTKLLPPRALLERLGRSLELLAGGARDLPPRQRTLRATIDWSHDLLEPDEQRLFARLAVFAGGCTLEAAEAVCGDGLPSLEILASLIDKSMLRSLGDEPRFSMLETQREYALERLEGSGEAASMRRRHLDWFTALAESGEPELLGDGRREWLELLEADKDNFRAALAYALATDAATPALRLAAALMRFWDIRGYFVEGRRWLLDALALPGGPPPHVRGRALAQAAVLSLRQGLHAEARALVEEAVALFGDEPSFEELATATLVLGQATLLEGDPDEALALYERAAAGYRAAGSRVGVAQTVGNVGYAHLVRGDLEGAEASLAEAVVRGTEAGDRHTALTSLLNLAFTLVAQGKHHEASARLAQCFAIGREVDHKKVLVEGIEASGAVAAQQGLYRRAARLLGAAETHRALLGSTPDAFELGNIERARALVAEALEPETLAAVRAEGRRLELEEAVDHALRPSAATSAP